MLEFEFNSPVDTATLVEFFARCGWTDREAGPKLEWAMAASDLWVVCRLDGQMVGFGRSSRLSPLKRVVFDVLVDSRFIGHGLRTQIVRLLSQKTGGLEEVAVYTERDLFPLDHLASEDEGSGLQALPLVSSQTYLGKTHTGSGGTA